MNKDRKKFKLASAHKGIKKYIVEGSPYGYDCNGRKIRVIKEYTCDNCGKSTGMDLSDGSRFSSSCGCSYFKKKGYFTFDDAHPGLQEYLKRSPDYFTVNGGETWTISADNSLMERAKGVIFFDDTGKEIGRKYFADKTILPILSP